MKPSVAAPYYVEHFLKLLDAVEKHYSTILSPAEKKHITSLRRLPLSALCLYVRLVNRKGPYFRVTKLQYEECAPLAKQVQLLLKRGLLVPCEADALPYAKEKLFDCFTYPELRELFKSLGLPKNTTKAALCELPHPQSVLPLLARHEVVAVPPQDCWNFIKFLFFGELTDNLSGFVVQELGHIVTEQQPEALLVPYFTSRKVAEDCFRMACLYQQFRELRASLSSLELLVFWQAQNIQREAIEPEARTLHDRLIEKLGRLLEREGQTAEAKGLYAACPVAPLRERHAKLLVKEGNKLEALALCADMLESPYHAEEEYAARQLMARLQTKQRGSEARRSLHAAPELEVEQDGLAIEASVLRYYQAHGWQGVHGENRLWNALFGLLLWDIIYDPRYGSFHQPLQMAPADLYKPQFYALRQEAIESRLSLLFNRDASLTLVTAVAEAKQDTINPFLGWHGDLLPMLAIFLEVLPAEGLIAVLRHMAQDVKRRCKGFPDLFLWRENEYQLIEVKSVNDQLSPQQYGWLQFMSRHGIEVRAVRALRTGRLLQQQA